MTEEQAEALPKYTPNPLFSGLSDYLKDPKNFEDIQRKIQETIFTSCVHSTMSSYAECAKCTEKMLERRKLLVRLGFKNASQYLKWVEVHKEITRRMPLR